MPNIHLTLKRFLAACLLGAVLGAGMPALVLAATYDGGGVIQGIEEAAGVGVPQGSLADFISATISRAVSYATLAALLVIVVAAFMLILGFGNDEWKERAKKAIIYTAIGLVILFFAQVIVDFFASAGQIDISGPVLNVISTLVHYSTLAALLAIVVAGMMFIISFGNEERKEHAKRIILYAIIGLIILFFAQVIVDFFAGAGQVDITDVILSIIGMLVHYSTILALLAIVVACIVLILSFGNEERKEQAKRIILYAIIGLLILFFAQVIVDFFAGAGQVDITGVIFSIIDTILSYAQLAALLVIVVAGFYLILSFGNEEAKESAKRMIIYAIVGLLILFFAQVIVNFFAGGGIAFDISGDVLAIINTILSYAQLAALLVIVVAGFYLILSFGNEEAKERAKRMIIYAIVGLLILFFAQAIVNFFAGGGFTFDISGEVFNIINTILSYAQLAALLVIVVAGFYLILSFGNEEAKEQVKRMIIYAIVGLLILFFAQAIVNFFAGGGFTFDISGEVLNIINAILSYAQLAALFVIVVAGFYLILSFGNEEAKERVKRMIIYAIVGLLILFFAQVIVNFFAGGGFTFDISGEVFNIINTILSYAQLAALLVIVVAGFYLILSFGNEEAKESAKRMILYAIVGLLILFFAQAIVNFFAGGGIAFDITADVLGIINTIVSYASLAGVFVIVIAGFYLILGFGDEEVKERVKRMIIYVIVGLLIIYFAQFIVNFFAGGATNVDRGPIEQLLITITNYLALAAVITVVVAGIILILSFGNEERKDQAKRIIFYTLAGLFIVLFSRVIVRFVFDLAGAV